ncbi:MAG: DUF131 domain-containing protein [Candidatus Micrarchaeaceae archaeon]
MHEILIFAGMALILAGFFAIMAYIFLNLAQQSRSGANASFGGVVMIGPIPIAFGNSPKMVVAAEILAIVLIIIAIVFFFVFGRR